MYNIVYIYDHKQLSLNDFISFFHFLIIKEYKKEYKNIILKINNV